MPPRNLKIRCTAIKRKNGERCRNPPAFGCRTCRYHGARRPSSIKRGKDHPQYRHGRDTKAAQAARSEGMSRLRDIEDLGYEHGLMTGNRTPGAKPKGSE